MALALYFAVSARQQDAVQHATPAGHRDDPFVLNASSLQIVDSPAWWQDVVMMIRDAVADDAVAGCQVLKRSITELCVADHQNDPAILGRWLGNKTPEVFMSWVMQPDNSLLVAVEDGNILAVGSVIDSGKVTLNYVSPDARFRGVGRTLLGALEARALKRGNIRCTLTSTETAHSFYRVNGYVDDNLPIEGFGISFGYPMSKLLTL